MVVTPYLPASFLSGPLGGPEALERKWMPAPNRPKPAKTYLEQFDAVVAEVSDVEGGAAVAFGASPREIVEKWGKLRECRVWTNPKAATNQLPKITMSPDSFEQTLVSDDDYVTEYPKVVPMEIVTMDEGKAEKAFVKYRKAELKKQNKAGLDVAQEILEITADVRCCAKDALDAELHKEGVEMAADEKREWRLGLLYETDDEDDVDDDRKRYKITDILPHGPAADAGLSVGDIILSTAVKPANRGSTVDGVAARRPSIERRPSQNAELLAHGKTKRVRVRASSDAFADDVSAGGNPISKFTIQKRSAICTWAHSTGWWAPSGSSSSRRCAGSAPSWRPTSRTAAGCRCSCSRRTPSGRRSRAIASGATGCSASRTSAASCRASSGGF